MKNRTSPLVALAAIVIGSTDVSANAATADVALATLMTERPDARVLRSREGRIARLYGTALGFGASPAQTAQRFVAEHAGIWGVAPEDLSPVGPFDDGRHEQRLMYDRASGSYRFTAVYYTQTRFGVPVYGSRLMVLVRNEPGHPAVLAGADLKDMADAAVVGNWDGAARDAPDEALALAGAQRFLGAEAELDGALRHVVFAGADGEFAPARLAIEAIASVGTAWEPDGYQRRRLLIDTVTGDVIHEENLVLSCGPLVTGGDVTGTVTGMATEGSAADECGEELPTALPYARIENGTDVVYADADGVFSIPAPGEVTISSAVRGQWFRVYNFQSSDALLEQTVTPPATVDFIHSETNDDPTRRAEVNAYLEANRVRDYVLSVNPDYPAIGTQEEFTVRVNIDASCNASYSGDAINFRRGQNGCNNTAFSTVVHHEYGHHLVQMGGSGQGSYGEGMSDVMGVLMTGDSVTGRGFHLDSCGSGLRNANNNCQLTEACSTCGTAIHACGRLISGAVWDTWNALISELPDAEAYAIISNLVINSIPMHTGNRIDQEIAVDFLVLDDDDTTITNGTPHYDAIEQGFELEHGIPVPDIQYLLVSFPQGRPFRVEPSGETTIRVDIEDFVEEMLPGSAYLNIDTTVESMSIPLAEEGPGQFGAAFPAMACGTAVTWFISAETTAGTVVVSPPGAPADRYESAYSDGFDLLINDNFETDMGWAVSGDATGGVWERGVPPVPPTSSQPNEDGDGSGQAYGTDWAELGESDVDGTTVLTSPLLDGVSGGTVEWSYWLATDGDDPAGPEDGMRVEISTDPDGTEWTAVRSYTTYTNAWRTDSIAVGPGGVIESSPTLRLRVVVFDLEADDVVEAAFDGVFFVGFVCECAADIDGTGEVDFQDLLEMLTVWGSCTGCPEDLDGNGEVGFQDLLALLVQWGPCP